MHLAYCFRSRNKALDPQWCGPAYPLTLFPDPAALAGLDGKLQVKSSALALIGLYHHRADNAYTSNPPYRIHDNRFYFYLTVLLTVIFPTNFAVDQACLPGQTVRFNMLLLCFLEVRLCNSARWKLTSIHPGSPRHWLRNSLTHIISPSPYQGVIIEHMFSLGKGNHILYFFPYAEKLKGVIASGCRGRCPHRPARHFYSIRSAQKVS